MPTKRNLTPEARRHLLDEMRRVDGLGQQQEYAEAKKLALNLYAALACAGLQSAHLTWLLAVFSDYLDEMDEAFHYILEAMAMDPLEPTIEKSFGIVTEKLRRLLLDPDRDPSDESTPRLHGMLVRAGKADDLVHLALARHLEAVGKAEEALRVLDAVLLLSPGCRDAWVAKAGLAKLMGRGEVALEAEAEAVALDGTAPVPLFGVSGKAVA